MKIKPGMTKEQYVGVLGVLGGRSKMLPWIIGDLIVYGEQAFGEEYAQLVEALGLAPGTLAQYAWVAKNIPPARRVESSPTSPCIASSASSRRRCRRST